MGNALSWNDIDETEVLALMSGEDVLECMKPELCLSRANPKRETLRDESSSGIGEGLLVAEVEFDSVDSPKGLKDPTYPDEDLSIMGGLVFPR